MTFKKFSPEAFGAAGRAVNICKKYGDWDNIARQVKAAALKKGAEVAETFEAVMVQIDRDKDMTDEEKAIARESCLAVTSAPRAGQPQSESNPKAARPQLEQMSVSDLCKGPEALGDFIEAPKPADIYKLADCYGRAAATYAQMFSTTIEFLRDEVTRAQEDSRYWRDVADRLRKELSELKSGTASDSEKDKSVPEDYATYKTRKDAEGGVKLSTLNLGVG